MTETRDFKPVDRSGWPSGPWDDEPDRIEWIDEATGAPCLMKRNGWGAWCGYSAVNPGHPLHGVNYMDACDGAREIEVHGGLTYSDLCSGGICHVPQPGEPDDVWWFGFDCGHGCDLVPSTAKPEMVEFLNVMLEGRSAHVAYRDGAYVREQVTNLARQLAAIK